MITTMDRWIRPQSRPDERAVYQEQAPQSSASLETLDTDDIALTEVGGEPIESVLTHASNGAAIGGLKVTTENAWFAVRPSGTEEIYKIYAESFLGADHVDAVAGEVVEIVKELLEG